MGEISGNELVDRLREKFECASDSELALKLGYSSPGLANIRKSAPTARSVAELVSKSSRNAVNSAVRLRPVVEFFPVSKDGEFLSSSRTDHKQLAKQLQKACGIYAFYNSEFEAIYVGKTVLSNLLDEAKQALNREMLHYKRYFVGHPHGKFRVPRNGLVRKIAPKALSLSEAACYFSAYAFDQDVVTSFEQFIIRLVPNDLLNVRMEGNTLEAFEQ